MDADQALAIKTAMNTGDFPSLQYLQRDMKKWFVFSARTGNLVLVTFMARELPDFDVNAYDRHGFTALHRAAEHGHRGVILFLLKKGARSLPSANHFAYTPLMMSCSSHESSVASLEALVNEEKDLDLNALDRRGNTALCYAVSNGFIQKVRFLLRRGANRKMGTWERSLEVARINGHEGMKAIFVRAERVEMSMLLRKARKEGFIKSQRCGWGWGWWWGRSREMMEKLILMNEDDCFAHVLSFL